MTRAQYLRYYADRLWDEADKLDAEFPRLHNGGDGDDPNKPTGRVDFSDQGGEKVFLNGYPDGSVMFGVFGVPESFIVLNERQALSFAGLLLNWNQFRRFGV